MENKDTQKTIKNLAKEDRPREKLKERGVESMTNSELLAIIIGSGSRGKNVIELAQDILKAYDNDVGMLLELDIYDLVKHKGIGYVKALIIIAAIELAKRGMSSIGTNKAEHIRTSNEIYEIFRPMIGFLSHEEFWAIYLNNNLNIIKKERISTGNLTSTIVDIKRIIKLGIDLRATRLIIVHNHPSGNLTPSKDDMKITDRISKAASTFEITLEDHIIVSNNGYFSFSDHCLIHNNQ